MLKKERQYKYFDKRWEAMLDHLRIFSQNQDPEAIHHLRVEIKKIYALLALIEKCSADIEFSEYAEPVKKIFKEAGGIRDAQINLQLISSHGNTNEEYENRQRSLIKRREKKFCSVINTHIKDIKKPYTIIRKSMSDIKNDCILKFYKKQMKKVEKAITDLTNEKQLHKCRKRIKKMIYIHGMLDSVLKKKLEINIDYLGKLEEAISKWHDSVVTLDVLRNTSFAKKQLLTKLENQCKRMIRGISILSRNFSKKIVLAS
jgi:CHAD domain-containing protein